MEEYSLCVLCCYSFPTNSSCISSKESTLQTKQSVDKFIQEAGVVDKISLSSVGLVGGDGGGQVSICGECLPALTKVAGKREQVEEVEGNVRRIQEEILRLMRQLREVVEGYLEEMRCIEEKIKSSDEDCLRSRFAGRRGRVKKGTWSRESAFQFRNGILNVIKDLSCFRDDLSTKFMHSSKRKDEPVDISADLGITPTIVAQLKMEDIDVEPEEAVEDFQDFDYSPDPVEDNSSDEDYILPTSTKIPSRKRTRLSRKSDAEPVLTFKTNPETVSSIPSDPLEMEATPVSPLPPKIGKKGKAKTKGVVKLCPSKVSKYNPNGFPDWYTHSRELAPSAKTRQRRYFQCLACNYETRYMFCFDQHMRFHDKTILASSSSSKPLTCSQCPATFGLPQSLEFHLYYHQGMFKTVCDICNKKQPTPFVLPQHLKEEHQVEKIFSCANCVQVHSSREKYLRHLDYHYYKEDCRMACDLCTEAFPRKKLLLVHYEEAHNLQLKKNNPPSKIVEDQVQEGNQEEMEEEDCSNQPPGYLPLRKRQRPSWYASFRVPHSTSAEFRYYCVKCPKFFARNSYRLEQHLKSHEKEVPPEDKSLECEHCPAKFGVEQYFQLHQCYHQGQFQMLCDICRVPRLVYTLKQHFQEDHKIEKVFECASCSLISSSRDWYLHHLLNQHKGKDTVCVCDLCPATFNLRQGLVDHLKLDHGVVTNDNLLEKRRQKAKLKRSQAEKAVCPECGKTYSRAEILKEHIQNLHRNANERPYKCPVCNKAFKTKANLIGHSHIHKRDASGIINPFQCHLCTKGFKLKSSLETHMRLHDGTGVTCEECGMMFGDTNALKHHQKKHVKHANMVWWECNRCSRKFPDRQRWEYHQRFHQKRKEVRCEICNKVFHKTYYLNVHLRAVHTNERPFVCDCCGKSYPMKSTLKHHYKVHHPVEYRASMKKGNREGQGQSTSCETGEQNVRSEVQDV